ncbi:acyl-CoA dehydrogenase family protein [Aureimonas sp. D3]|uniref:acyl-CoA dehydrogenase family protein n=1 Tax=Aureimonas sp. D3 TaxID=1638164 RepID=UPI001AEBC6F5|nr:acyl-CoA dehydrogenase family protein [Aureimonas sp. D3]
MSTSASDRAGAERRHTAPGNGDSDGTSPVHHETRDIRRQRQPDEFTAMEELSSEIIDGSVRALAEITPLAAARADGHEADLTAELEALRRHGCLAAPMRPEGSGFAYAYPAARSLPFFVALGSADLSLGRLFEGHANALQLVSLFGRADQKAMVRARVEHGALLGVWGADGSPPFAVEPIEGDRLRLTGAKRYASGLGWVSLALVPVTEADGRLQLLLIDVDEPSRLDFSSWNMRGMRASRSGTFRFDGMEISVSARLGGPDDYRREPFFMGGIWRCAAVQLGAVERIVRGLADGLRETGRLDHPLQSARVGEAILAARDARLQVEAAARAVEGGEEAELAASLAVFARLRVESAGLAVIPLAERGLGLSAFAEDHPLARSIRDLSTYLRQANPDAALLDHARRLAARLPEIFR